MIDFYFSTSVDYTFGDEDCVDPADVAIDFNVLIGVDDKSGSFGIIGELFICASEIGSNGDILGTDNFSSAFRYGWTRRRDGEISGRAVVINTRFLWVNWSREVNI